jgi:hypothetical protein
MTSAEFVKEAVQNKTGKNKGKRSIWFNGRRKDKTTGLSCEHCKALYRKGLRASH